MLENPPFASPKVAPSTKKDIKWVEVHLPTPSFQNCWLISGQGLRGISSVFIVTSHLYLALNESMRFPGESEDVLGSIIRLPILRLHTLGAPWLAIFFILTGFINVYKPIKQARKGDVSSALTGLASSAFRRPWRLVLPCILATVMAWIMTQLGFFNLAHGVGEIWLRNSSPVIIAGWWPTLRALFGSIYITWTGGVNPYDNNQWCMFLLLKGSMLVYIVLLATLRCTSRYRMLIFLGLFVYSHCCLDSKAPRSMPPGLMMLTPSSSGGWR